MKSKTEQFNGVMIEYFPNGKIYAVFELDSAGLYNGPFFNWYDNGCKRSEIIYSHGKQNGTATYWYSNGIKRETHTCCNSKLHGLQTLWNTTGEVKIMRYYHYDEDITSQVQTIANDLANITDYEKTQIAIEFGFIL
jgi:antitoxin component YwqK of YwqJK toxin-antitoxin module